jgi:GDP-L-fucose synthase
MSDFLAKRVVITGGKGFLGKHLVAQFELKGYTNIIPIDIDEYDLRKLNDIKKMYKDQKPDIVVHLAARVGGIGANREHPGEFFYDNLIMGIQMIEHARLNNIEKFVSLGTICCYPKFAQVPFKEDNIWEGYPEETNAPYGLAKKMLLVQTQAYHQQYGFNGIYLLPVNLYGPGDNFDPQYSHVIPALIKKIYDAMYEAESPFNERKQHDPIVVWGTGKATREFLYVEDCAEAIILATERYNSPEPVNIGAGFEISVRDLVAKIAKLMHYNGDVRWDDTYPDGQPRRMLDTSRAEKAFGFKAKTQFNQGLQKTVEWYSNERQNDIADCELRNAK